MTAAASAGRPVAARWDRLAPPALAAAALAAVLLAIQPFPVGVFQDDGIYAVLGKSLATGEGYRFLHLPGAPRATHYPPLYPALLAVLWKLWPAFPANVALFKFANAALVAVAAGAGYRFARGHAGLPPVGAALAVGAFTTCTPVVLLGVMVLSEPLFLAALFPVLALCERAAASGRARDAALAGLAAGALGLVRTLGVAALPATALALAWRRRWGGAAAVLAAGALVLLPWQAWVALHAAEVPTVLLGKYGSYGSWLGGAIATEGPGWLGRLVAFNVRQVVEHGWETVAVTAMPAATRWAATLVLTATFAAGWWRLARRAPVAALMLALYLALVLAWPFHPARFTWAVWPLVGIVFGLAVEALASWRPAFRPALLSRVAGLATAALVAAGYAGYNATKVATGWISRVQAGVADRARPLAQWVLANTPGDAVLATDDDVLIYLYTGRQAVPNGTFTPQEYLVPQTPAFAVATLRTILRTWDVDYVLASSDFGTWAAAGLVQADPPELRIVRALAAGAVFAPVPGRGDQP